jgi:hypothetical protein
MSMWMHKMLTFGIYTKGYKGILCNFSVELKLFKN